MTLGKNWCLRSNCAEFQSHLYDVCGESCHQLELGYDLHMLTGPQQAFTDKSSCVWVCVCAYAIRHSKVNGSVGNTNPVFLTNLPLKKLSDYFLFCLWLFETEDAWWAVAGFGLCLIRHASFYRCIFICIGGLRPPHEDLPWWSEYWMGFTFLW